MNCMKVHFWGNFVGCQWGRGSHYQFCSSLFVVFVVFVVWLTICQLWATIHRLVSNTREDCALNRFSYQEKKSLKMIGFLSFLLHSIPWRHFFEYINPSWDHWNINPSIAQDLLNNSKNLLHYTMKAFTLIVATLCVALLIGKFFGLKASFRELRLFS